MRGGASTGAVTYQFTATEVIPIENDHKYDYICLYFHCAKSGHKLDAVKRSPRASFCVIVRDDIAPKEYTTHYKSVIVFGTVGIIEEEGKKKKAIEALGRKYAPDDSALNMSEVINKAWDNLCMLEMTIEHKTGKVGKALAQEN